MIKYLFAMTVMLLGVVGTSTLLIKQLLAIAIFIDYEAPHLWFPCV